MLYFNPKRVFALRGIPNPLTYLMKNGFGRGTANNLLNFNNRSVKFEHLERLCVLLRCTPNDLYDWKPGKDLVAGDDHPLNALKRTASKTPLEFMKELPLEKLDEMFAEPTD